MSLAIIYNGLGTDQFCVDQTVKSYEAHLNDKEVQIQIHDHYSIERAAAQQGVNRKWIVFPGGLGDEMAKYAIATSKLLNLWNTQEKVDFIGHCAGSIYLGQKDNFYFQNNFGTFSSCSVPDTMGAYQGVIAAPCLPWTAPTSDPSNCKAIRVQHRLNPSNKELAFHSCVWLGPAFPRAFDSRIIRAITDPVDIQTKEGWPLNEQGTDLPIAILNKNSLGNRVFLQGDHLEIDPAALDQEKFDSMYSISQSLIQKARFAKATLPRVIQLDNFQGMKEKLMASNAARIEALRDGMALLNMPLK